MTVHHDKKAYGRLASSQEDLSEEKLREMLNRLSDSQEDKDGKTDDEPLLSEGEEKDGR